MAIAAKRSCLYPGCPNLVDSGRCPVHSSLGGSTARGYDRKWRDLRMLKLTNDPVCEIRTHCDGDIAVEVDHRIPFAGQKHLRLQYENLQSTCHACHADKTARENGWAH